jgi:uncharacterized protein YndB with AHSA1/START domain
MADDRFIYVTYIRTTQEKLWTALREPEFTRQYFFGVTLESEWTPDSAWRMVYPDGKVTDSGKVIEIDPPRRLVLSWRNELRPELKAEGYSRATFELETQGDMVKLTVVHEIGKQASKLIEAVSGGWPIILSSLKSLLETGKPLERPKGK